MPNRRPRPCIPPANFRRLSAHRRPAALVAVALGVVVCLTSVLARDSQRAAAPAFRIEETTIAQVHAAMKAGRLTCRALVQAYLRRIDAYDKNGPALNAIVVTNPKAVDEAGRLDAKFRRGGLTGPLHCVPMIVKDNFETIGLQSAGGSLSLQGFVSDKDAFLVKRVKEAGAIVLAKSNMAEFAFSPYETVNSILPGYTKNPYALDRVTAGSSGGTAAAIAANFGLVGLGSDTGNSIRGPSAHQALAGIRSTMGLTSRAGVIPLNLLADIAGPMARTLTDAVAVFQAIAGEDAADPVTAASRGRAIPRYADSLIKTGLKGARVGVLHQAYERGANSVDPDVAAVFAGALQAIARAGAQVVDPAAVDLTQVRRAQGSGACMGFKYDINAYLAAQGDRVPVHNLDEIIRSNRFHPSIQLRLQSAQQATPQGPESDACKADAEYRRAFGAAVTRTLDDLKLDAFVYPTWSFPPRLIGDLNTPHGDNSQVFAPTSGFPAINVPMGYTRGGRLPAGLTFFGRAWDETTLIRLAFAFEQATHVRHPPASTPPLGAAASR
jgi:Asp-tRNA(Asn)/Glu-tRNA(Gln) amidotransferase A subunit family amidase